MRTSLINIPITLTPTIAGNGHFIDATVREYVLEQQDGIFEDIYFNVVNGTDKPITHTKASFSFQDASNNYINSQIDLVGDTPSQLILGITPQNPIQKLGLKARNFVINGLEFNNLSGSWTGADELYFFIVLKVLYND